VIIPVLNKSDALRALRKAPTDGGMLHISAKRGDGLDILKQAFIHHLNALNTDHSDIVVTNARHVEALTHARDSLLAARQGIQDRISGELLATDLRRAQYHLGEITGRITPDDLLGSIFSRFCIGK